MGFKDFLKKSAEKIREANKPENIEKRLTEKIKVAKLKSTLEQVESDRRERKEKNRPSWSIGDQKF